MSIKVLTPILISLHRGYGIGDACQMSSVLRHVKRSFPNWHVSYQAEEGKHQIGKGIVDYHFAYGSPQPMDWYESEVLITLYNKWYNFTDRPNTHVTQALKEHFALDWNSECGRYQVNIPDHAIRSARYAVKKLWHGGERRSVAFHYRGDSAKVNKDLDHIQASDICNTIYKLNCIPLILDWRDEIPIYLSPGVVTTGQEHFSRWWGASIEMNCAVISQCAAFIGIDSGPAKCASATDTPSLVIWTGHHPAQFHDPAPNTTHLVPKNYHSLSPVCNNSDIIKWFESNYKIIEYSGNPVGEINDWLKEVLK